MFRTLLLTVSISWSAITIAQAEVPLPEMVELKGGAVQLGSATGDENERNVRTVSVKPFAIGRYEVTVAQFAAFATDVNLIQMMGCRYYDGSKRLDDAGRSWAWPGFRQSDTSPVVCVSWDEAQQYAKWLSKKTGEDYRLPTEDEWEYAARGGMNRDQEWVHGIEACTYANISDEARVAAVKAGIFGVSAEIPNAFAGEPCNDGAVYTAPVGTYPANGFGLYDMLGNAWEMTTGCAEFAKLDNGKDSNFCLRRAPRGGSWLLGPKAARASNRSSIQFDHRNFTIGFRIAKSIAAKR
jgi:formylglycine-generating enzyme required for sulfatase activity